MDNNALMIQILLDKERRILELSQQVQRLSEENQRLREGGETS